MAGLSAQFAGFNSGGFDPSGGSGNQFADLIARADRLLGNQEAFKGRLGGRESSPQKLDAALAYAFGNNPMINAAAFSNPYARDLTNQAFASGGIQQIQGGLAQMGVPTGGFGMPGMGGNMFGGAMPGMPNMGGIGGMLGGMFGTGLGALPGLPAGLPNATLYGLPGDIEQQEISILGAPSWYLNGQPNPYLQASQVNYNQTQYYGGPPQQPQGPPMDPAMMQWLMAQQQQQQAPPYPYPPGYPGYPPTLPQQPPAGPSQEDMDLWRYVQQFGDRQDEGMQAQLLNALGNSTGADQDKITDFLLQALNSQDPDAFFTSLFNKFNISG